MDDFDEGPLGNEQIIINFSLNCTEKQDLKISMKWLLNLKAGLDLAFLVLTSCTEKMRATISPISTGLKKESLFLCLLTRSSSSNHAEGEIEMNIFVCSFNKENVSVVFAQYGQIKYLISFLLECESSVTRLGDFGKV